MECPASIIIVNASAPTKQPIRVHAVRSRDLRQADTRLKRQLEACRSSAIWSAGNARYVAKSKCECTIYFRIVKNMVDKACILSICFVIEIMRCIWSRIDLADHRDLLSISVGVMCPCERGGEIKPTDSLYSLSFFALDLAGRPRGSFRAS